MATIGHYVSDATREKIRNSLAGRSRPDIAAKLTGLKQSEETKAKRAESLRKHVTCTVEGCDKAHRAGGYCSTHYRRFQVHGSAEIVLPPASGSAHPRWKGNAIGYDAAHLRARGVLASACVACGTDQGRLEAALRHDADQSNLRTTDQRGPFSVDVSDYVTLCVQCHRQYDSPVEETRAVIEALIP